MVISMKYKACSFTGHRQINTLHKEKLKELIERAISYLYENGCRVFYTGGAVGFDTFAANAVLSFRESHKDVKLGLILPCENQAEHWGQRDKAVYEKILSAADSVEYIAHEYYDGCMRERNLALAANCDVLIAYNGRSFGGSAQTVRLAASLGKDIYNLYPHCS